MKLIVALASTAAALLLGAGIYSVATENDNPTGIVTESDDNPFAGLDRALANLEPDLQAKLSEEEAKAEEDYLSVRLSPDSAPGNATDGPKTETENVPYRTCEKDPYVANRKVFMASGEDAMVRRSIYTVVRLQHTLNTGDCTCAGKVAPFSLVTEIVNELERAQGNAWDREAINDEYWDQARRLQPHVDAFCGGEF